MTTNTKIAIIETGGKQYKVKAGTILDIEKISADENNKVSFDKVLLVSDGKKTTFGKPYINGATVEASLLNQIKGDKLIVFKFKRKTGYKLKQGHRQQLSTIKVEKV
jgi:large subunit ribosomal protein L21